MGQTPLLLNLQKTYKGLCYSSIEEVTQILLKYGADIAIRDKHGHNALFYAEKNEKITQMILSSK